MSDDNSIFTFRVWSSNGDTGVHIGWAWIAIIAVVAIWFAV